jgi:phage tail-like protein
MPQATPAFLHYVYLNVPELSEHPGYLGVFRGLTGLEVSFHTHTYHEGGNNDSLHLLPGRMEYPNLVLSWGVVKYEELMKWFWATREEARLSDITLTLSATNGRQTKDVRTFTFTDAFPVRWSGPQIALDAGPGDWSETLEIAHSGLKLT